MLITAQHTLPAQLATDGNSNVKIKSSNAGKEFSPEEISAQVLRKLTASKTWPRSPPSAPTN